MHGPTKRQRITAAALLFSDRRARPTQAELAKRFGISQQAVSRRLRRFTASLSADQAERYRQCLGRGGRKIRLVPVQLSLAGPV